jgi:mRNA interferase YafQ
MMVLISGKALDPIYRDHQLKGEWRGWRECHVTSDWLLIYQINAAQKTIRFERLGSHAELF